MIVNNIMSTTVVTLTPEDFVKKAASYICLRKISGIPVVDEHSKLVGMLSEKDILRAIYPSYQEFYDDPSEFRIFSDLGRRYNATASLKVKDIYTKEVISVQSGSPVLKALSLMLARRVRRLPVLDDDGRLIGIVSQGDIHQALFNEEFLVDKK